MNHRPGRIAKQMKIHLPQDTVTDTNQREQLGDDSVIGDWQLDRSITSAGPEHSLLQFQAAPAGTPTHFDYLLHTPADPNSASALSLLQREFHISQQLSSPHLLPVLDVHLENPPYFIVTPRLPGDTLRTVLHNRGKLELYNALWLLRQAAEAVAALHARGWSTPRLHADNLQIEPDGHLTLSTVGHARRIKNEIDDEALIYADTCRLAGLFMEMTNDDLASTVGNNREFSRQISDCYVGPTSSVTTLLREMLNPSVACDKHSVQILVERLVRLEIGFLSRPA